MKNLAKRCLQFRWKNMNSLPIRLLYKRTLHLIRIKFSFRNVCHQTKQTKKNEKYFVNKYCALA